MKWRRMERIDRLSNDMILNRITENRTLLDTIILRTWDYTGHVIKGKRLKITSVLDSAVEGGKWRRTLNFIDYVKIKYETTKEKLLLTRVVNGICRTPVDGNDKKIIYSASMSVIHWDTIRFKLFSFLYRLNKWCNREWPWNTWCNSIKW